MAGSATVFTTMESSETLGTHLLAGGIQPGPIEDAPPGPGEEMRGTDPDGYVLLIAQID